MINHRLGIVALLAFFGAPPLFAVAGPLAFSVDEKAQSYTITEQGCPVLTYRFGEVPLPAGIQANHFSKRDTPYAGEYFTDGSRYGGEPSPAHRGYIGRTPSPANGGTGAAESGFWMTHSLKQAVVRTLSSSPAINPASPSAHSLSSAWQNCAHPQTR